MDKIGPVLLFLLAAAAVMFGSQYVQRAYYSRTRRFDYGGESFLWVPDDVAERSFFRKQYDSGSFQYADGTPVTDLALERALQEAWLYDNQPLNDE